MGHSEAKRLNGLEVYDQLERDALVSREVGPLGTLYLTAMGVGCARLRMYATDANVSNLRDSCPPAFSLLVRDGLCGGMSTSRLSSSRALREFYATAWSVEFGRRLIVR